MAGTHHCLALALFDEIHGHGNGGVLLPAHCIQSGVRHLHHLRGVYDFHAFALADLLSVKLCLQNIPRTGEVKLLHQRETLEGEFEASNWILRGYIAAHGIKGKVHVVSGP